MNFFLYTFYMTESFSVDESLNSSHLGPKIPLFWGNFKLAEKFGACKVVTFIVTATFEYNRGCNILTLERFLVNTSGMYSRRHGKYRPRQNCNHSRVQIPLESGALKIHSKSGMGRGFGTDLGMEESLSYLTDSQS